jgi:murein DD-endopeptidase MepM/ murein hydrolase activator NlpD/urea transporter
MILKSAIVSTLRACLLSYSQIFFSQNQGLAVLLLAATFVHPLVGLAGLLSVLGALWLGKIIGLNTYYLQNGAYTYNVLLSALALATVLPVAIKSVVLLILAAAISLLMSVWMAAFFSRYKLPVVSFPFTVTAWLILISLKQLPGTGAAATLNNLQWLNIGTSFVGGYFPDFIRGYFISLAAILFQSHMLTGVLIAIGLFVYSRIAFSISFISYLVAAYTLAYFQNEPLFFNVATTGFNYIFVAVSLCGYFLIPSLSSYMLAIGLAPVVFLFQLSLQKILEPLQVPAYSLAFSFVVVMVLAVLQNRSVFKYFLQVQYQLFSPEKNLYAYHVYVERFKKDTYIHLHLPFYGEWMVTQSYDGNETHQGDYRYAWDFEVVNDLKKPFRGDGLTAEDYYCYGLPVLAPADGFVVNIKDGVEDNHIGDMNLLDNWGNCLVLKHDETLYSKLAHLKKDSFKVKNGDYVKKGDILALCGNSGRSPQPHIHFQIQNSAKIGAKTLAYPICYFLSKTNGHLNLHAFDSPRLNQLASKPFPNATMRRAFHFIPGTKLSFAVDTSGQKTNETWEVFTNSLNQSYFYCHHSGATAYFTNNDTLFYFTTYTGSKDCLLYHFYLAAHKVLLSAYPGLEIQDTLPIDTYLSKVSAMVQDFLAPFYIYTKPWYRTNVKELQTNGQGQAYEWHSQIYRSQKQTESLQCSYSLQIDDKGINRINITEKNTCITATAI